MKIQFLFLVGLATVAIATGPKVTPTIWSSIKHGQPVDIIISFKNTNLQSVRDAVKAQVFTSRTQRIQSLHDALKSHADSTQAQVLQVLAESKSRSSSIQVTQLWMTNQIAVKAADRFVVQKLVSLSEIASIEQDRKLPVPKPTESRVIPRIQLPAAGEQWGVKAIEAPEVWQQGFEGVGATVAIVDTGVLGSHESLKDGFRALNGWYDPSQKQPEPYDNIGHGTHLAGIAVGRTLGIGVAPKAQWIACRGCNDFSCSTSDLLACGQWALCPTNSDGGNARCDLAPTVVTNGWGAGGGSSFYDEVINNLEAAGIVSVFPSGNSGSSCGTIGSPGDNPKSLTVSSLSEAGRVADSGSAGPAPGGEIKPDVAAPGEGIISASIRANDEYIVMTGSSIAAPFAAGSVALLKSKRANVTLAELKDALFKGAQPTTPTGMNCGGIDDSVYPNNHAGWGKINVRAASMYI